MKDQNISTRQQHRFQSIIKQAKLIKKLSPEKRWEKFAELQNAVSEVYWQGLKDRFPYLDDNEIKSIAYKEAKQRDERRKRLRNTI